MSFFLASLTPSEVPQPLSCLLTTEAAALGWVKHKISKTVTGKDSSLELKDFSWDRSDSNNLKLRNEGKVLGTVTRIEVGVEFTS